jgi:uncharacterized BrkB/YihY/UPF0761 family membrane protein
VNFREAHFDKDLLPMWVYYSAQILSVGAEFTQVYAQRRGRMITPPEAHDGA